MMRAADVVSVASPKRKMRMATTVGKSATTVSSGAVCYVFPPVMRYQTGMTIVMTMMCLYTGSANLLMIDVYYTPQMSCMSYVIG